MKQKPIFILLFVVLILGIYFLYQQNQESQLALRLEIARLASRPAPSKNGKAAVDPYQAKQVKNTLTKHSKDLQTCYLEYLKTKPSITKGSVKMDWQVKADGEIKNAGIVHNSFGNKALSSCLLTKLSKITFPPPPFGSHYIEHKLNFQTEEDLKKMLAERSKLQQLGR